MQVMKKLNEIRVNEKIFDHSQTMAPSFSCENISTNKFCKDPYEFETEENYVTEGYKSTFQGRNNLLSENEVK